MNKPGIGGKTFYIKLSDNWFRKGDIITTGGPQEFIVIKSYRLTWWKKIIMRICWHYDIPFRFRSCELKVKEHEPTL